MTSLLFLCALAIGGIWASSELGAYRERERMRRWYQRKPMDARNYLLGEPMKLPSDKELFD